MEHSEADLQGAVAHQFQGGSLDSVSSNGDLIVKSGNTYSRIPANQVNQAVKRSQHVDTSPRLSDDTKKQINAEKWNNQPATNQRNSYRDKRVEAEKQHRSDTASKYGIK